ncbi:probable sulfate transporter [Olea europaea subsp. europaea]|uniref:Probable sulfate transporter n=1 Tax=Olea europaea subsp. europaea TaxID=158383 RepID=A0A8S0V7Q4_OLEEU|nr:probable sulfate transporter [Olea europaea subsp. europaea]
MEPPNASNSHCAMEIATMEAEVHKVAPPPRTSTLQKFKTRFKETLFPEDPFRQFKDSHPKQNLYLELSIFSLYYSGVLNIISNYSNLLLFLGISYAKLANLPPIVGLYSSFVPPIVYAVLGSSSDLAVGPVSIASQIMGSMLRQEISPGKDPNLFLQLAFSSTALFQASIGFVRLGFIIDFLSKATIVGFMAGAAIIVSLQQLKSLLGITNFTKQMGLVPVLSSVFHRKNEVNLIPLPF